MISDPFPSLSLYLTSLLSQLLSLCLLRTIGMSVRENQFSSFQYVINLGWIKVIVRVHHTHVLIQLRFMFGVVWFFCFSGLGSSSP